MLIKAGAAPLPRGLPLMPTRVIAQLRTVPRLDD